MTPAGSTTSHEQRKHAERRAIAVGIDGSADAERALKWAVTWAGASADRFGPIRPVVVWRTPWWATSPPAPGAPPPPPAREVFEASASELADAAIADIPENQRTTPVVLNGHAGRVLCNVATRAGLLVVGSRGRWAVAETVLGSTGAFCAAQCDTPVVIVPPSVDPSLEPERVIVGIDGSDASVAALTWAIDNTSERIPIVAVHAYTPAGTPFETLEDHDREGLLAARARDTVDLSVQRGHSPCRPQPRRAGSDDPGGHRRPPPCPHRSRRRSRRRWCAGPSRRCPPLDGFDDNGAHSARVHHDRGRAGQGVACSASTTAQADGLNSASRWVLGGFPVRLLEDVS